MTLANVLWWARCVWTGTILWSITKRPVRSLKMRPVGEYRSLMSCIADLQFISVLERYESYLCLFKGYVKYVSLIFVYSSVQLWAFYLSGNIMNTADISSEEKFPEATCLVMLNLSCVSQRKKQGQGRFQFQCLKSLCLKEYLIDDNNKCLCARQLRYTF